ncbi:MAG: diversity-generating retroelement protein Avd [Desulfobacula sp.]|nr:diversity-generating retroelement protein Avd [Desulfobacula sp.]
MNKTYPLFEHWYKTLDWILSSVEKFPKNARFSLASRIADLALEAMELIIEAIYSKNRINILNTLNLHFEKLRVLFRIAHDRKYISIKQYEYISKDINEAGKMTGGWKKVSV